MPDKGEKKHLQGTFCKAKFPHWSSLVSASTQRGQQRFVQQKIVKKPYHFKKSL